MRLAIAAWLVLAPLAALGCGGLRAADLFIVFRAGPGPQSRLTLLVNEEGAVHCNGRAAGKLSDAQIVEARGIQEDLHGPASEQLSLPPQTGSVFSYRVRDPDGSVRFADNSRKQPPVLRRLALFVVQTAQQVCHLPQ